MKKSKLVIILFLVCIITVFLAKSVHAESQHDLDFNLLKCYYAARDYGLFVEELREFRIKYPDSKYLPQILVWLQDLARDTYTLKRNYDRSNRNSVAVVKTSRVTQSVEEVLQKYFHILFSRHARFLVDPELTKAFREKYNIADKNFLIYRSDESIMIFDLKKDHGFLMPIEDIIFIKASSP